MDSEFSLAFFAVVHILATSFTSGTDLIIQSVSDFIPEENPWLKRGIIVNS